MAVRVLTLFLAVMALAGVVGAQDAFGCSCVPRSTQQVIDGADAAFTGTVVEVRDAPGTTSDGNPDQPIDIRFRVETVYKGELGEEVVVRTSTSGGTCGLGELEPGTRQSLGLQGDEGLWSSSICDTFDPSEVPVPLQPAGLAELARPSPISGWRNVAVWSAFDDAVGAYRLMIADGDAVGPLPVEPSPVPFDADVGPDSSGDPAIVYSRCRYAPSPPEERSIADCDLFIFGLRDDRGERPISNANSAGSEFNPALWRGEVAWVRTYEGNPDEPFVYTRQLVAPRERRSERASGVPHKPTGVVRVEELELYGRNLALDATSNPNDSGGGTANELRLFDLHDDTSRRVARVDGALSGRDYVGVSMDAGRVAWHLTCRGDPAGCVDEGGAFRHRISTDDVERVRDATELAGFAWTLGGSYRVTGQEPSVLRTGPLDWRPIDADRVR